MKVYILIANNMEEYEDNREWIVKVFASREAAQEYAHKLPSIIEDKAKRFEELNEFLRYRELTDLEAKEREEFLEKWDDFYFSYDYDDGFKGIFMIKEYELE